MEESDVVDVASGISKELLKEIAAQHAIIDSAVKLINQHLNSRNIGPNNAANYGDWVYNMKDLEGWLIRYNERQELIEYIKTRAREKQRLDTSIHGEKD